MAIPQPLLKEIALEDELRTSIRLIEIGFGELQGLNSSNRFHHLTMQLLASGFERLMKCHICYGHLEKTGDYPSSDYLRNPGHDLLKLKALILKEYFQENSPALTEDRKYLESDQKFNRLLDILSEFGKYARYYNLDVVTDSPKPSRNVASEWEQYRDDLVMARPELIAKLNYAEEQEVFDYMAQDMVITLEKFTRAICRQFTLGKLGVMAQRHSPAIVKFIVFSDNQLGIRNYRIHSTSNQPKGTGGYKRTILDDLTRRFNSDFKHKKITKAEFNDDEKWPFYNDEVIIECRKGHWCVVTIDGYDYALNGAAQGKYKLESVHAGGMAVIGKSVGPFIQMARELANKN